MLHRILGISTVVAIGSLVFIPTARAQVFTIPFEGEVEANCEVTTPASTGTLILVTGGTQFTTDTNGTIDITCNDVGDLNIQSVNRVDGGPDLGSKTATVTNTTTSTSATWDDGPLMSGTVDPGLNEITASMTVQWPGIIPADVYQYEVNFTVTAP